MPAEREEFGSWLQFLFSAIGSLVGLGNIWRFPYVCYRNGGGAFLIPFCLCMLVLGMPIGFLEILYCQYSSLGPGRAWVVCPLFKGIWFGMMIMTFVVTLYYIMLMAWILYYLGVSFSSELPWSTCGNPWNTENCVTKAFNRTLTDNTSYVSSQEEFWVRKVLDRSSGIDDVGEFRWELVLCLLAAWVVVFLCLANGVKVMGKIAYIAATLPYILLIVLLIRGLMLPGSGDGIRYFFQPDWSKLGDYTVWRDAALQLFFSAGYGFGIMATLASYNKFHNNCYRDAMLMPFLDTATSLFAGVIIFAYIGYMAHISHTDMDKVVQQGPGLVFIAYPSALETLPFPQVWSVLFFLMLFCTGLDSQYCHIQAIATALLDNLPNLRPKKTLIILVLCVVSFTLGVPLTTQAGEYILNLLDWYIASISLMAIVVMEVLVFAWIYGTDRLYENIEHMIGYRIPIAFKYAWKFTTPLFIFVLWLTGIVDFQPIGAKYPGYPLWSDVVGVVIALMAIVPVPLFAAWTLWGMEGPLLQRIREAVKPTKEWRAGVKDKDGDVTESMTLNLNGKDKDAFDFV